MSAWALANPGYTVVITLAIIWGVVQAVAYLTIGKDEEL